MLLLCSHSLDLAAYEIGLPAFRSALRSAVNGPVVIHLETMGGNSFATSKQRETTLALVRDRYSDQPLDVVAFLGMAALEFGVDHADEIAPDARKMFFNVSKRYVESLEELPAWSGVTGEMDVRGSIRMALEMHPKTRHVAIVSCQSDISRLFEAEARKLEAELGPEFTFEYMSELRYEGMLERLSNLPQDSIAFYILVFDDGSKTYFSPARVVSPISEHSKAPLYGGLDSHLEKGIVGGVLTSFEEWGRRSGLLCARMLNGDVPKGKPVIEHVDPVPMFDWNQLKRWDLDVGSLPKGSIVVNRPPSLWDEHKGAVVFVLFALIAQTVVIALLVVSRRATREAQLEAQQQRENLARMDRAEVMGQFSGAIAHEINQPLTGILGNAQAIQLMMSRGNQNEEKLESMTTAIVSDAKRAGEVIRNLRELYKEQGTELEPLDLNQVIEETLRMIGSEFVAQRVQVELQLGEVPTVLGNKIQLQQVLVNLILNAGQAMLNTPEERHRMVLGTRVDGSEVVVWVEDSGPGIPPELLGKIFEPLATWKSGGTGMGLAICHSLIDAHHGRIWAENIPGGGACICFALPVPGAET